METISSYLTILILQITYSSSSTRTELLPLIENIEKNAYYYSNNVDQIDMLYQSIDKLKYYQMVTLDHSDAKVDKEAAIEQFMHWSTPYRHISEKVEIRQTSQFGNAIFTVDDMEPNEMVIKLDSALFINAVTCEEKFKTRFEFNIPQNRHVYVPAWEEYVWIALEIINEKLNENSVWKPYIDVLPENYTHPLNFNVSDLRLLRGTEVYDDTVWYIQDIALQYCQIWRQLGDEKCSRKTSVWHLDRNNFTFELFQWAIITVTTRALQTSFGTTLVPYFDMINHGVPSLETSILLETGTEAENSDLEIDGEVHLHTKISISAGSQLLIDYDDSMTMHQFFTTWGIVVHNRPIWLPLSLQPARPFYRAKKLAIRRFAEEHSVSATGFTIHMDGPNDVSRKLPIRQWALQLIHCYTKGKNLQESTRFTAKKKSKRKLRKLNTKDKRQACRFLARQIVRQICSLNKTYHRDSYVNPSHSGSQRYLAVKYIDGEIELLKIALKRTLLLIFAL